MEDLDKLFFVGNASQTKKYGLRKSGTRLTAEQRSSPRYELKVLHLLKSLHVYLCINNVMCTLVFYQSILCKDVICE